MWTLSSIVMFSMVLSGLVNRGQPIEACTCSCHYDFNNGEPSSSMRIQGDYCDTNMRINPDMKEVISCQDHDMPECRTGDALLRLRRDICACVVTQSNAPFCRCRKKKYPDVQSLTQISCTCAADGNEEEAWSSDSYDMNLQKPIEERLATTESLDYNDIEGVDRLTTADMQLFDDDNSTQNNPHDLPIEDDLESSYLIILVISASLALVILVLIATCICRKMCRNKKKHDSLEIRYDANNKLTRTAKMKMKQIQQDDDAAYAPINTSPDENSNNDTRTESENGTYATAEFRQEEPTQGYDIIGNQTDNPRAPARIPTEYHYITPKLYAQPYSDIVIDDEKEESSKNDNIDPYLEILPDSDPYIEILPS